MTPEKIYLSILNVPDTDHSTKGKLIVDYGMTKDPMPHTLATRWAKKMYPEATQETWAMHIDFNDTLGVYLERV